MSLIGSLIFIQLLRRSSAPCSKSTVTLFYPGYVTDGTYRRSYTTNSPPSFTSEWEAAVDRRCPQYNPCPLTTFHESYCVPTSSTSALVLGLSSHAACTPRTYLTRIVFTPGCQTIDWLWAPQWTSAWRFRCSPDRGRVVGSWSFQPCFVLS